MTDLSRRHLLGAGLALAGGAVVTAPLQILRGAVAGAVPPLRSTVAGSESASAPSLARWTALVGQSVRVTGSDRRRRTLVLHSARSLRADRRLEGDGYILIFRGPHLDLLPEGLSVLRHRTIRPFSAGLLPVDKPTDRQDYQLIIDRRRPVLTSPR
jgi:hypothetical protein